jgi:hypothetical protein
MAAKRDPIVMLIGSEGTQKLWRRKIEDFGALVIPHYPGSNPPAAHKCDIGLCVTSGVPAGYVKDVRDAFRGKRVFFAQRGMSEVSHDLEIALAEVRKSKATSLIEETEERWEKNKPQPVPGAGLKTEFPSDVLAALKRADAEEMHGTATVVAPPPATPVDQDEKAWTLPPPKPVADDKPKAGPISFRRGETGGVWFADGSDVIAWLQDHLRAGTIKWGPDALEMFTKLGALDENGNPLTGTRVSGWVTRAKKLMGAPMKHYGAGTVASLAVAAAPVPQAELLSHILSAAKLSAEEKVRLSGLVLIGQLKTLHEAGYRVEGDQLVLFSKDMLDPSKRTELRLTKSEAKLFVKHQIAVHNWVDGLPLNDMGGK